jgi:Raf kinase inhibitor-like YbhB/YbcL family protein
MRKTLTALTGVAMIAGLALVSSTGVVAQDKKGGKKGGFQLPPMIHLKVEGFADGGTVPDKNTCKAGQNAPSPAISWTGAPANTMAYVLLLHDPDPVLNGSATDDVMHWMIFDIPGDKTGLPAGVPTGAELPDGSKQVKGFRDPGFFGPCAPPGHGAHHYTFEIWGLSQKLGLPATATRQEVMMAMNGKVTAKGVYIGMFGQPAQ